jgi:hypothetical protein
LGFPVEEKQNGNVLSLCVFNLAFRLHKHGLPVLGPRAPFFTSCLLDCKLTRVLLFTLKIMRRERKIEQQEAKT